ncbi:hypothetical protein N7451_004069 [Penicillium sp. IBT 35674x]|nr:hypothetical protein N7451_004069 [Penicillium sp. IBT 35674x]
MSKIFVGGLASHTDDSRLRQKFAEFGTVDDATVMKDGTTGHSRGFGFVRYASNDSATSATSAMNDTEFDGGKIRVSMADSGSQAGGYGGGFGGGYAGSTVG